METPANKIKGRSTGSAVFALCLLLLGNLAFAAKPPAVAPLVWPFPPEEPRIAYVQSISQPADLGLKGSGWSRFANWLIGTERGNEKLVKPFAVAVDESDNLCITDTGANAVCLFDAGHKKWHRWDHIEKIRFASPVAVAKRGDVIYVADSILLTVLAFNTKGKLLFQLKDRL